MADIEPFPPIVWGDDIEVDTIPKANPVTVPRTNGQGYPSQYQMNWEEAQQAWFKNTVVKTNTRLTKVYQEVDGAYAAVTVEANARADADEAFAEQITTVEARVGDSETEITQVIQALTNGTGSYGTYILNINSRANQATASGQIYLKTKAAPSGSTAAYGWYLTAGDAYAGMEALALSGGGSAIGFSANQFRFVDSGSATAVWTYSGGKFQFTGAVAIDGSLTINGTLFTAAAASRAFTQGAGSTSGGTSASVSLSARSGAQVVVIANYKGLSGYYLPLSVTPGSFSVTVDGSTLQSAACNFEASGTGTSAGFAYQQTCLLAVHSPSAGSHTYTASVDTGIGGVTIAAIELAR